MLIFAPEMAKDCTDIDVVLRQINQRLRKLYDSLERNTLDDVKVCHQRTEVVSVLDAAVGSVAVVHAAALSDLLAILLLSRLDDQFDVDDLRLADFPVWHAFQRTATAFAVGRLVSYNPVRLCDGLQGVAFMSRLSAAWFPAWLAKGLCPAQFTG